MSFSADEKRKRQEAIRQILAANNLQAMLFIGDMNVGHGYFGDFRYYTNNTIFFQRQIALAFPDSEPVMFAYSEFSKRAAEERSFIADVRSSRTNPSYEGIGPDPLVYDAIDILTERGVSKGRLGVSLEMLPVSWYQLLKKQFPQLELVDAHEAVIDLRLGRTAEEAEMFRRGAALGDAGFLAALKMIRPGVSEFEIAAEIEYATRRGGAEQNFTLVGSGTFTIGQPRSLPLPCAPSERRIQAGDSVFLEITPKYQGYWTQLVRILNVGRANPELQRMQTAARNAIEVGLQQFKPGGRVMDVTLAMQTYIGTQGLVGKPPFGHICALDLVEERVHTKNERVLEPGLAAILHPMVYTADNRNLIFWGQTYLTTPDGYERLHHATDELLTV